MLLKGIKDGHMDGVRVSQKTTRGAMYMYIFSRVEVLALFKSDDQSCF